MSNLVTKNSNELEEISQLYKHLTTKLNTEHLGNSQYDVIHHKLNILNDNLCTIHENIEDILKITDGVIIGSSLKVNGDTWKNIDLNRAKKFMKKVRSIRKDA